MPADGLFEPHRRDHRLIARRHKHRRRSRVLAGTPRTQSEPIVVQNNASQHARDSVPILGSVFDTGWTSRPRWNSEGNP